MTRQQSRADDPGRSEWTDGGGQQAEEFELGRSSAERTRAANQVGSAIAHQLTGPLTALRLYIGEIRRNTPKPGDTAEAQDQMLQMVEGAFQETERICAMMTAIADSFEEPFCPETAAALGRDVITWWSRSGDANEHDPEQAVSIHELLTRGNGRFWAISARGARTSRAPS
jgi:signal transduction histidine kinase